MELTVALPWAIFGAITVGVWAFANAFTKEDSRASQRLEELRNPSTRKKKETDKGFKNVLIQAFPVMAKALGSKSEFEQNELRVRLANAGYNHENALQIYLGSVCLRPDSQSLFVDRTCGRSQFLSARIGAANDGFVTETESLPIAS